MSLFVAGQFRGYQLNDPDPEMRIPCQRRTQEASCLLSQASDLQQTSVNSFGEVMGDARQFGSSVVFDFAEGRLVVNDMRLSQLDSDDFIF